MDIPEDQLNRLVHNFGRIFGVAPTFHNVLEFSDFLIELERTGQLPEPFPEQTGVIRTRN